MLKKRKVEFMWECSCGYLEYGEGPPADCPKCFRVGKFEQVPEDEREEREAEKVLAMNYEEFNDGGEYEY